MGCAMPLRPPPPGLPTRRSERLLSPGLSRAPSFPRPVSAPSRRGGLAALRAGERLTAINAECRTALQPPEPGAPPRAGRRPPTPGPAPTSVSSASRHGTWGPILWVQSPRAPSPRFASSLSTSCPPFLPGCPWRETKPHCPLSPSRPLRERLRSDLWPRAGELWGVPGAVRVRGTSEPGIT